MLPEDDEPIVYEAEVPADMDLSQMVMADMRFAEVTTPDGREAVIALAVIGDDFHAGGGWDRQTAMLNMMKSVYPELRQIKIAPSAWSSAAEMFAPATNEGVVVDDSLRQKRKRHEH